MEREIIGIAASDVAGQFTMEEGCYYTWALGRRSVDSSIGVQGMIPYRVMRRHRGCSVDLIRHHPRGIVALRIGAPKYLGS